MEEKNYSETEIFVCDCHSFEHQAKFMHTTDDKNLFVYIHLNQHKGFWKRLVVGLKYAFGHSSRFGEWDEFVFQEKDQEELRKFLNRINNGDPLP
jgi:hypothetical protein